MHFSNNRRSGKKAAISIHLMLMLIDNTCSYALSRKLISIHLMLMLIHCNLSYPVRFEHFNTSHVNVNRQTFPCLFRSRLHFNTSHVNVNPRRGKKYRDRRVISIRLMLMLIAIAELQSPAVADFNTSHVNVNLGCRITFP